MINKDYILRLAEQLGRTLAILLRLRERNQHEEALIYIDDLFLKYLGLTSRLINSLSEEKLLQTLSPMGAVNIHACLWAAVLLKGEGDIYEAQENSTESYYRYRRRSICSWQPCCMIQQLPRRISPSLLMNCWISWRSMNCPCRSNNNSSPTMNS
jgi:hypothetical protein